MGLDTSHNCWHGPYGAFTRWRNVVAKAAGYSVWTVKGTDGYENETVMLDWGHLDIKNPDHLNGEWVTPPSDPLVVLIAHQDCEGVIHPEHAGPLADRLEALLPSIPNAVFGLYGNPREKTEQFIRGLREAVSKGEDVDFH